MGTTSRKRFRLVGVLPAVWAVGVLLGLGRVTTAEQDGRWHGEAERGPAVELRVSQAPRGRLHRSVITGIIVSNSDPDRLGRVRVSFPSIHGENISLWAAIVVNGAGLERGRFILPEVGEKVLVAFLNGDPDRPVVLGRSLSQEVLPARPGAPTTPQGTPDQSSVGVRHSIRQSIESGQDFLVVPGIVVEKRGPEEAPRIKVKFPWVPRGDPEPHKDTWALEVQTTSARHGTYFLPEVGDEVAVAFPQGDLRQPVLLGALLGQGLRPVEERASVPFPSEEPSPLTELPPGEGWCCHRGEVFVAPEWDCRELGGESFRSSDEAERACRH
jgi:uncharacterized protein involved in type VI secretion and phage assembly